MADPITKEYTPFIDREVKPVNGESWWTGAFDFVKDTAADLTNVGIDALKQGIQQKVITEVGGTGAGGSIPAYQPVYPMRSDLALASPNPTGIYYDDQGRPYTQTDQANRAGLIPSVDLSAIRGYDRLETTALTKPSFDTTTLLILGGIAVAAVLFFSMRR